MIEKRALFTFLVSSAGGRTCPLQAVIAAGHFRYKLSGASKPGSDRLSAGARHLYCHNYLIMLVIISPQVSFIW